MMPPDNRAHALDYLECLIEHDLDRPERHLLVDAGLVEAAFPASGELDSRPAGTLGVTRGEFMSLAAAFAGNRPVGGESTSAQAQRHFSTEGKQIDVAAWRFDTKHEYHFHRIK